MNWMELLLLLAIAGLCGALGQALTGVSRGGCLVAIALGFVGAWIGAAIARALDLPPVYVVTVGGTAFPIVWSIAGAALFVAVISMIAGGKRRARR